MNIHYKIYKVSQQYKMGGEESKSTTFLYAIKFKLINQLVALLS